MRTTANDIAIPDLTGTLAVVTGANSGIGFGVSQRLAAAGALVILAVRNTDKGNQAAQAIRAASPHAQVVVEQLDLASLASVEAFAARLLIRDPPINTLVLVCGAKWKRPVKRVYGIGRKGNGAICAPNRQNESSPIGSISLWSGLHFAPQTSTSGSASN